MPRPVDVRMGESNIPREVCWEDEARTVEGVVEQWRIDDEWWREPIARRCVEVVLTGGKHVVLFEDLQTGNWFLQDP